MIRTSLSAQMDHDPHFRWRGEAVTRIENLSDIVFALALGMLVSAASPPTQFLQVQAHLIGIIPVAFAFGLFLMIWNAHFTFFRRYGVADGWIIFLNAVLLLVILFIAYPMRFIFDSLFAYVIGGATGDWSRMSGMGLNTMRSASVLMGYFTAGYAFMFTVLLAMYSHAMRKADLLGLSASERVITRRSIWRYRAEVLLGISAMFGAIYTSLGPFAGFILNLNWPATFVINRILKLAPVEDEPGVAG